MQKPQKDKIQYFQEKEDEFITDMMKSIEIWRNQGNLSASNSPYKKKDIRTPSKYKYKLYKKEYEEGRFKVDEYDIKEYNLKVSLGNSRNLLRKDHLQNQALTREQKFKQSMKPYTNSTTISAIMDRAQVEASESYIQNMKKPCNELLANQKRIVGIRGQLVNKIKQNPNLIKEQSSLESKFNAPRRKQSNFSRKDIYRKINEITTDLKAIEFTNEDLEEQIAVIEKAKATLESEKTSYEVSLNFEKERLADARKRLHEIKSQDKPCEMIEQNE
ncbi:hypothetical protein TRFO_32090 [Tritrichomonas foetus]|uniref:Uncharacterized protein n=1 Tax=Tritrichomonas foetus TaxID=1144522 RepID=A0A1J4JUK3_9EUKA|nr:hypothetical protein TRFO_32090 [Tritrichomonas foetus]|eukprot:OHT01198.1 hypothetical protein TRFO_32090 [Tritrichomonas foetus]